MSGDMYEQLPQSTKTHYRIARNRHFVYEIRKIRDGKAPFLRRAFVQRSEELNDTPHLYIMADLYGTDVTDVAYLPQLRNGISRCK